MALFGKQKKEDKVEKKDETQEKKRGFDLPSGKDPKFYKLIKKPVVTEKATSLKEENKYVFSVSNKANKIETKKAIEKLYDVKVRKISIVNTVGKRRQIGRFEGWKPGFKKAIITLEKGYSIEITNT